MKSLVGLAEVIAALSGFVLAATQNWTGALVCGVVAVLVGLGYLVVSAPRLSRWLTVAATIPILVGGGLIGATVGHRVTAADAAGTPDTRPVSGEDATGSVEPPTSSTTTTTTTTTGPATGATTGPTTTTTQDVPDGAYWVGPLQLQRVGMDVDSPPPRTTAGDDLDIYQNGHVIKVNKGQGRKIVVDPATTPSKAGCQELLDAVANQVAAEIPLPTVPGRYCFTTTEDRLVTLELTERTELGFDCRLILWE